MFGKRKDVSVFIDCLNRSVVRDAYEGVTFVCPAEPDGRSIEQDTMTNYVKMSGLAKDLGCFSCQLCKIPMEMINSYEVDNRAIRRVTTFVAIAENAQA